MLQGCILPRDVQVVEGLTENLTAEIAQSLFTKCDMERVLAEGRAAKAEEDAYTLRATRAWEVEDALQAGYDNGWDATGVEYKKQVREIKNELFRDRFFDGLPLRDK
ncbi:hypothetical protein RHMOL_Rhmol06G0124600 [Rhododendron molle]|uniref:Uncharacterized protein n=1 Tax=Rhododendron molle TaxID=49168 RepID=A0ACC0NCX2_RHOML|nr:hypothetical protein RHMOL_Rhmol06G0124600 [Rhododendron molle]